MPPLLKHDAIRLIESSIESLHLAISSIGTSKRIEFRESAAMYAPEIALIGIAAELAMSGCLIQAYGTSAISWPTGQFKTFGAILKDFRELINTAPTSSNFLVQDVQNPIEHRQSIIHQITQFRRLASVRAGGLHAGRGILWEAIVVQANCVADFLYTLSMSSRLKPYLGNIPRCLLYDRERMVIVEDLARRLNNKENDETQLIASIFLVLPDVPDEKPEWLEAFDRLQVAPKKRDVSYLLDVIESAVPASLKRASRSGSGISVVVRPDDPNAIPIAPHDLRRNFNEVRDQWYADIATANGRLDTGVVDLPPPESVSRVFALGLESSNLIEPSKNFQSHEAWPFIAASLNSQGTPGPYWFLVRRTDDFGQLSTQLKRAADIGGAVLKRNIKEFQIGLSVVREGKSIQPDNLHFSSLIKEILNVDVTRGNLFSKFEKCKLTNNRLPDEFEKMVREASEGSIPVGTVLEQILESEIMDQPKAYWARIVAEIARDKGDLPALVKVISQKGFSAAHTATRKAIRRIDFLLYGPSTNLPSK